MDARDCGSRPRGLRKHLGTAIGVIPCGKDRIIVPSLDIVGALDDDDSTASVVRKMLVNFIGNASWDAE